MLDKGDEPGRDPVTGDPVIDKGLDTPNAPNEMPDENYDFAKPIQFGDLDPESPEGLSKQELIIGDLSKMFRAWEMYRLPFESLWAECYAAFMSVLRAQKVFTRARVFVPVAFQVVEAAVPKLVNIILGQTPFFSTKAERDQDMDLAKVIQNILEYQLFKADFYLKFIDFAKQLMMYGTSYLYVYWKVKRGWSIKRTVTKKPVTFFGIQFGSETVVTKERVYGVLESRPEVDVIDTADVYPDPDAPNETEGLGFFIRTRVPLAELQEMGKGRFPVYANTEKLSQYTPEKGTANPLPMVKQQRRAIRGTVSSHVRTSGEESMVDVITFWGLKDLDGDGIREEVTITIANQQVLLQAKANPFDHQRRPLLRSVLFTVPKEWHGMGIIEPVLPLISELNTLRNQGLDVNNLIINRMWKVNSMADIDVNTLVSVPNGVVLTDDMNGIEPLAQAELPNSVYEDSRTIQADIENTTAPRSVQGTPESGTLGRTSSGAQLIITQALEKFGLAAKLTEDSAVQKVLRLFHQLNQQFIPEDDNWNPDGFYGPVYDASVSPDQLRAEVRFKLLGVSETITKEAKINQIISFLTIFKGVPGINLLEAAKIVWSLMDTGESAEEVIQAAPFPQTMIMNQLPGAQPEIPGMSPGGNAQSIANQVASNGASAPAARPGARSM